jgi:uncharacterized membrane protein YhaH (DUF805 family)
MPYANRFKVWVNRYKSHLLTLIYYLIIISGILLEFFYDKNEISTFYVNLIAILFVFALIPPIILIVRMRYIDNHSLWIFDVLSVIILIGGLFLINAGYMDNTGYCLDYPLFTYFYPDNINPHTVLISSFNITDNCTKLNYTINR